MSVFALRVAQFRVLRSFIWDLDYDYTNLKIDKMTKSSHLFNQHQHSHNFPFLSLYIQKGYPEQYWNPMKKTNLMENIPWIIVSCIQINYAHCLVFLSLLCIVRIAEKCDYCCKEPLNLKLIKIFSYSDLKIPWAVGVFC